MASHLRVLGLARDHAAPAGCIALKCYSTLPAWFEDLAHDEPIRIASHVRDELGEVLLHDGPRSEPLRRGRAAQSIAVPAVVPPAPGRYRLEVDLIVENRFWGADVGLPVAVVPLERTESGDVVAPAVAVEASASERDEIRAWITDESQWPTGDSHDPETFEPRPMLAQRERELREHTPAWFWRGEPGASMLSVGAGKLYFERRFWRAFDHVYVVDPAERTRMAVERDPRFTNQRYVGRDLFGLPSRLPTTPRYAWIGAACHYLFGEHCGWNFLNRLALHVSDTLVIDGGVFDADSSPGQLLLDRWPRENPSSASLDARRRSAFSYEAFLAALGDLWRVEHDWVNRWVDGGRRGVVLRRHLPPAVPRSALGGLELVVDRTSRERDAWRVYRCQGGYFKEIGDVAAMLHHDTVGKLLGWPNFVAARVVDGDRFSGFVVPDYGANAPADETLCEALFARVAWHTLPIGLLPVDMTPDNVRVVGGQPIWIDVDLRALNEFTATCAAWAFFPRSA